MNIYLQLTQQFNEGRLRAVITSGQAVVLHRVAVMSKDGDWILREDEEALGHVRTVLAHYDARYRFGAPLDLRWLKRGWSSHFEFRHDKLRVRTDFFTRPPRLSATALTRLWEEQQGKEIPCAGLVDLAEMKKTNREKDYPVIGELARLMEDPIDRFLYSRSARDLISLAEEHPDLVSALESRRAVLGRIGEGRDALEAALDAERRALIRTNEERLAHYARLSAPWAKVWPKLGRELWRLTLSEAHRRMVIEAERLLPMEGHGDING